MIKVLGRAMNGSAVEGYVVQDMNTIQTGLMDKRDLWVRAKNKEVYSVEASGSIENPVLTGTNGFQLKTLPTIKANTQLDSGDIAACYIRNLVCGNISSSVSFIEFGREHKKYIEADTHVGILTNYNKGILSNSIRVVNTLGDDEQTIPISEGFCEAVGVEIPDEQRLASTSVVVGYVIQNIGDMPIPVTRLTVTPDHTQSVVMLEVGQKVALSRAELALLASKPEIGCRFSNGKLAISGAKLHGDVDVYRRLNSCYFDMTDKAAIKNFKVNIYDAVSQVNIDKYFKVKQDAVSPSPKPKKSNNVETAKKLKGSSGAKGIFNAFKR